MPRLIASLKLRVAVFAALAVAGGAMAAVAVSSSQTPVRGVQSAQAAAGDNGPTLQTVPKSAFDRARVTLSAPLNGTPPIPSGAAAKNAARFAGPGGTREAVLAHCNYSALEPGQTLPQRPPGGPPVSGPVQVFKVDADCWVVSLAPTLPVSGGTVQAPGTPPADAVPKPMPFTYNVALIDAQTGSFLFGFED
jgi:hypothetical protein